MANLFSNILTASFHGSIVIVAVLILRLLLKKAPRKYICYLWLLAGLRLLMPFQIQSELSLQPSTPPQTAIRWEAPAPMELEAQANTPISQDSSAEAEGTVEKGADAEASTAISTGDQRDLEGVIPILWLVIAAMFLLSSMVSYRILRGKVRGATPIPGGWESDNIETAFILGFVRPQIYIPRGMTPKVRQYILAHERTHLDKGDHWIKMIGFLALALHWFNPLVWVAYILLSKDIEMACDERVVQYMELSERKAYSNALLTCSTNRVHYAASPVAFGEVSVKSRILSILNYCKPSFWMGLLSVLAICFVAVCLVTSPTAQDENGSVSGQDGQGEQLIQTLPENPPAEEENPDWGLSLIAEPLSNTTMNLYYGVGVDGIPWDGTAIYKDIPYWIQRWNGESWEEMPMKATDPTYEGSSGVELSMENHHGFYDCDTLDWTLIYGALPQGDYRIMIRPTRNGEMKPYYATFHIYANALTGEEAEAVERCETSLDKLMEGFYTCTIQESNEFGNLMPTMKIYQSSAAGRVDRYYGDICYSSTYYDLGESLFTTWDDAFRTNENKTISFPEGESQISDEEIRFVSYWKDWAGVEYTQYNTYTFGEKGALTGIDRLISSTGADGIVTQSQRSLTVEPYTYGVTSDPNQDPKDTFEAMQESPWQISFRVDDDYLKASGGEVWMSVQAVGVSNYTTDSSYWLEKRNEDGWEKLSASGDPSWGQDTYQLASTAILIDSVDWTPYYGELDAGLYRMGKRFYNGDESIIQYAEFRINPKGGIQGEGGQEAIARINAAVEKLRQSNYYITQESGRGKLYEEEIVQSAYWKYNGVCVNDYYDYDTRDGYSHSSVHTAQDEFSDLFYDMWTNVINWDEENVQVMFPEGASLISPERIVFATAYTGESGMMTKYDIRFDESGNLLSIRYCYNSIYDTDSRFTTIQVQEKTEEEIKAWVEQKQAQQQAQQ